MKKNTIILSLLLCLSAISFSQFNTPWLTNLSNSTGSGFVGIGIRPTLASTSQALFNLHLHGVVDYIPTNSQSGLVPFENQDTLGALVTTKSTLNYGINYGKSVRLGLTNLVTGFGANDGTLLMMAGNDFHLQNREVGNVFIGSANLGLEFNYLSKRLWLGNPIGNEDRLLSKFSRFNIISNDHGLYIQTIVANKTALRIKNHSDVASAIEIFGNSSTAPNFKVFGSGQVYARKYVTTLSNFPDYVFSDNYSLMPIKDLFTFISINKHLPNIPTAKEVEENGADLGELNRLLLEKIEELTLYIIQMDARISELEETNNK